jgi:hypothetical protein
MRSSLNYFVRKITTNYVHLCRETLHTLRKNDIPAQKKERKKHHAIPLKFGKKKERAWEYQGTGAFFCL